MKPEHKAPAPGSAVATVRKHLVCGAGGSRAILGSAGAIYACEMAGLKDWQTLGGVSGGSIPTVMLAGGFGVVEMLNLAVNLDFSSKVTRHATPLTTVIAFLLKNRFEYSRPPKGVLSSDGLGTFIDEMIPRWPKNYWTMAVVGRTQVLFTADGVYQYMQNGHRRLLSKEPAPLGLAVRASCAVPGIIDAVPYQGRYLFDGALSWDGQCPVHVVTRHFGASTTEIMGCDVGDEPSRWDALANWFWSVACGEHCISPPAPCKYTEEGVLMLRPPVKSVRSLQFTLTNDQKWAAVHEGFQDAVEKLTVAGFLSGSKLDDARTLATHVNVFKGLLRK